jgi:hypothetical protein
VRNCSIDHKLDILIHHIVGSWADRIWHKKLQQMSEAIIREQLSVARQHYPNITSSDPSKFNISFPNSLPFIVLIPGSYPLAPPRVCQQNQDFPTAITTNWQSFYTLFHLCQQLERIAALPRPDYVQFNQSDIQYLRPEDITDPRIYDECIRNLPFVRAASEDLAASRAEADQLTNDISAITQYIMEASDTLHVLRSQVAKLPSQGSPAQISQEALETEKQNQIQKLRDRVQALDADIQSLKDRFAAGEIELQAFIAKAKIIKEEQAYKRTLAAKLNEVFAWYAFGLDLRR